MDHQRIVADHQRIVAHHRWLAMNHQRIVAHHGWWVMQSGTTVPSQGKIVADHQRIVAHLPSIALQAQGNVPQPLCQPTCPSPSPLAPTPPSLQAESKAKRGVSNQEPSLPFPHPRLKNQSPTLLPEGEYPRSHLRQPRSQSCTYRSHGCV